MKNGFLVLSLILAMVSGSSFASADQSQVQQSAAQQADVNQKPVVIGQNQTDLGAENENFRRPRRPRRPIYRPRPRRAFRAGCVAANRRGYGRRFFARAVAPTRRIAKRRSCRKALRKCRRNSWRPRSCRIIR